MRPQAQAARPSEWARASQPTTPDGLFHENLSLYIIFAFRLKTVSTLPDGTACSFLTGCWRSGISLPLLRRRLEPVGNRRKEFASAKGPEGRVSGASEATGNKGEEDSRTAHIPDPPTAY